jgi:flagellar hook-associated protein 2
MSGIDVTSMTNEMMTSDYLSLNQLLAKEQTTQWTQDRYRSVISNMNTFNSNYFDPLSSNYMLSSNGYSLYTATSNNSAVTASVSNTAQVGNYTVNSATIATAAKTTGTTKTSGSITNSTTVSSALSTLGLTASTLNFTVNGGTTPVTYDLSANGSQTISQFMSSLSSQSGANFNYSELSGNFSAATTGTGSSQSLTIASTDSNTQTVLNKLFGTSLSGSSGTSTSQAFNGANGSFNITEPDGSSNTVSESSNQFSIDGVNYNFTNNISSSSPATIGVTTNTSAIVTKIQNFVNDYNNLIGGIQDAVNEKKNYSYQPLTTMQESQMTDSQITAWNQQAQQGLLENDDTLNSMLTSMREAFYTPVSGNSLTMADVGLSTSDDPTQGGKLTLDVSKLTSALESNPQQVINLFSQASTSDPSYSPTLTSSQLTSRNNEEGIFQRLSDITQEYVGTGFNNNGGEGILLQKAGMSNDMSDTNNTLTTQLKQEQTSVTDYLAKMTQDKTRYTTMYTNLQSALSQMNSQQSAISSMLSSSSSSSG